MERKAVGDAALAELGTFQGAIERNGNFRQQAINHNLGRNVRVVKLLGYLSLLRLTGKTPTVSCAAAIRQNFSSSQSMMLMGLPAGRMQAAHFLPGQVRIDGKPIWEYAKSALVRAQIEFLFAEVEHLPLAFNQADTVSESNGHAYGLCAGLEKACQRILKTAATAQPIHQVPMALLEPAYNDWHTQAISAFEKAITTKKEKGVLPELAGNRFDGYTPASIAARTNASNTLWNRDSVVRILDYYATDQKQDRTWSWVSSRCQTALREVEAASKGADR